MATEIIMPKSGMAMEEGVLVRWLKEVGDSVEKDEPIIEIETDKICRMPDHRFPALYWQNSWKPATRCRFSCIDCP